MTIRRRTSPLETLRYLRTCGLCSAALLRDYDDNFDEALIWARLRPCEAPYRVALVAAAASKRYYFIRKLRLIALEGLLSGRPHHLPVVDVESASAEDEELVPDKQRAVAIDMPDPKPPRRTANDELMAALYLARTDTSLTEKLPPMFEMPSEVFVSLRMDTATARSAQLALRRTNKCAGARRLMGISTG